MTTRKKWHRVLTVLLSAACNLVVFSQTSPRPNSLLQQLKLYKCKIVYESHRGESWDLYLMNADGSHEVNLTRTRDVDELYPHASADGTKICFVADEGEGKAKSRNVYYMNSDGRGRTKVAENAYWPFWNPDGTVIAYVKSKYSTFTTLEQANTGLFFFDLRSRKHFEHPNKNIEHLFNPCWSRDGKWIVTSVNGGKLGFGFAVVAIEANGNKVFNLGLTGCRPDFSADGKKIAWGSSDYVLKVANWDLTSAEPRITDAREIVTNSEQSGIYVYYADWSPDGKYVLFSRGPSHKGAYPLNVHPAFPGEIAEGWQICVADTHALNNWVALTKAQEKKSDKEPDWVPDPAVKQTSTSITVLSPVRREP